MYGVTQQQGSGALRSALPAAETPSAIGAYSTTNIRYLRQRQAFAASYRFAYCTAVRSAMALRAVQCKAWLGSKRLAVSSAWRCVPLAAV